MRCHLLLPVLVVGFIACGGSAPPASSASTTNANASSSCALGMHHGVATVVDTPKGVALTVVSSADVAELRVRARNAAAVHGPDAHEGLGHDRRHGGGGNHGLRSIDLPPMQAVVTDVEGGARIELVPMNPADLARLRADVRSRAETMNAPCQLPPGG